MPSVSVDFFRELYDFVYWGRDRILDTASALTEEQLNSPAGLDYPSIRHTLVHQLGAECLLRDRWRGLNPKTVIQPEELPTLDAIRERWQQEESTLRGHLGSLSDADLANDFEYTTVSGATFRQPLWQSVFQIVNHSTQHRSELALVLTQLGHSPGNLDYTWYLRERAKA